MARTAFVSALLIGCAGFANQASAQLNRTDLTDLDNAVFINQEIVDTHGMRFSVKEDVHPIVMGNSYASNSAGQANLVVSIFEPDQVKRSFKCKESWREVLETIGLTTDQMNWTVGAMGSKLNKKAGIKGHGFD